MVGEEPAFVLQESLYDTGGDFEEPCELDWKVQRVSSEIRCAAPDQRTAVESRSAGEEGQRNQEEAMLHSEQPMGTTLNLGEAD